MEKNIGQAVRESVRKATEEYIKNLDVKVNKMIEGSLFSILGLTGTWGRIEVDHCNGRHGVLEEIIREKAKDKVQKMMKGYAFDDMDRQQVVEAFKKEFKAHFDREVRWYAEQKAKAITHQMLESLTNAELKKMGLENPPVEKN